MPIFYTLHQIVLEDKVTPIQTEKLLPILLDLFYEDGEPVDGVLQQKRFYHTEEQDVWQEYLDSLKEGYGEDKGFQLFNTIKEVQLCKWEEKGMKVIPINGYALSSTTKSGTYKREKGIKDKLKEMLPEGIVEKIFETDEEKGIMVPFDITYPLTIDGKSVDVEEFLNLLQREGYDKKDMKEHLIGFQGIWFVAFPSKLWDKILELAE